MYTYNLGIDKLEFNEQLEILGMISSEKETVPLSKKIIPAKAKGMVEKWLLEVEETMQLSLKKIIARAVDAYKQVPRESWVLEWAGQVVICVSSIYWTSEVCDSMKQANGLFEYLEKQNKQIEQIVNLVRGKLEPGSRVTLEALTVIDVHARDVVAQLAKDKVNSPNAFDWLAQLRYYWHNDVSVCMITTDLKYGYEYLGIDFRFSCFFAQLL